MISGRRMRPPQRWALAALFAPFMLLAGAPLTAQAVATIRGVVVDDEDGNPVMGAEVLVQSTPLRALTGEDGSFEIPVPDGGTYTLFVIADGYGSAEVTADPAPPQPSRSASRSKRSSSMSRASPSRRAGPPSVPATPP